MKKLIIFAIVLALLPILASPTTHDAEAAGPNVGYYEVQAGQGVGTMVSSIVGGGGNPIFLTDLSPTEFATIDVLYAFNASNSAYQTEWLNALADIDTAVQGGLILVFHDNRVTDANTALPGGNAISFTQSFQDNIDFTRSSVLNGGNAGAMSSSDMDGGGSSMHGYATTATLPAGSTCYVIVEGNAGQCVAFSYPYGSGIVYYATIPLGAFVAGLGSDPARTTFANIYGPNVVEGAIAGDFMGGGPILNPRNNGEVTVRATNPVMVYENPGGNPVRIDGGSELFLPFDQDGNGFDSYLLSQAYTYNGELWLEIFIGGSRYVYIRAADVQITRGQLSDEPVEWVN